MSEENIIYVLTNLVMPGYVKIGKTENLERRIKELDNTSMPLPFQCFYASRVENAEFVEKKLHETFADHRTRKNREFFEVDPSRVVSALELAQGEDVTPMDDVTESSDDAKAIENKERRAVFNFKLADIPIGAVLSFHNDDTITCTVCDNRSVEFEGKKMSLSASAAEILQEKGYKWKTCAGTLFWMYEGESLEERRRRIDEED